MNEAKPTAKAATTVVSTPPLIAGRGGELFVEPARVVVGERLGARAGPPAAWRRQRARSDAEPGDREQRQQPIGTR